MTTLINGACVGIIGMAAWLCVFDRPNAATGMILLFPLGVSIVRLIRD